MATTIWSASRPPAQAAMRSERILIRTMPDERPDPLRLRAVTPDEKTRRVRGVFDSVADKYDLMNDLMSAGLHRRWKRFTVEIAGVRPGARVLDLAGGTGDLARLFAERAGPTGTVVQTDINGAMLAAGRDKLIDRGVALPTVQCNAEALPFADRELRLRVDRLRPAQRHAQGARAGRDGAAC